MRALTVQPGIANSARVEEVAEPRADGASVLIEMLAIGICGTDHEIVAGEYGSPPKGSDRLILGHESLGRVVAAPRDSGFHEGDLVAGIVRAPDPVPCPNCAIGEWDMCSNGRYTEHGIKELDGFAAQYVRLAPERIVPVPPPLGRLGVLVEPTSVVAKAWEHTERIGTRARWKPASVLVTGAGPIGLLAALIGVQRGLAVHVFDRATAGLKPTLVRALGATYHSGTLSSFELQVDIVMECTGAASVVADVLSRTGRNGIVCLTGVSSAGRSTPLDLGLLNRMMVLENDVVFGSVNANRRHYAAAGDVLRRADRTWLERLITRRVPLERWSDALEKQHDDVKVVLDLCETRGS